MFSYVTRWTSYRLVYITTSVFLNNIWLNVEYMISMKGPRTFGWHSYKVKDASGPNIKRIIQISRNLGLIRENPKIFSDIKKKPK